MAHAARAAAGKRLACTDDGQQWHGGVGQRVGKGKTCCLCSGSYGVTHSTGLPCAAQACDWCSMRSLAILKLESPGFGNEYKRLNL